MSSARRLRVLLLEDNPDDAELALLELQRAGFSVDSERVESEEALRAALRAGGHDLVLADYNLPSFDAGAAFDILHELAPDLPFIIVSGSIGEDMAVEAMQRGAADYILKDRLARLGQAARRAVDRAQDRRRRRQAETRLRHLEQRESRRRVELAERGRLEAEAASASKSEFLNMAAHELRTPLSVLSGYLSLLLEGSLGPPGEQWLDTMRIIQQKTAELNRLVDSLLQAARIGGEAPAGEARPIDLAAAASDAVQRAGDRARLQGATVLLAAPSAPVLVQANEEQVSRILNCLIDNALTYADGPAWVKVTVAAEGAVDVEDRGPGIPAGEEEAIFERFHRVAAPGRLSPPGAGLGLYIARSLAHLHGGTLELVPSPACEGSRFRLWLPAASPAPVGTTA